MFKFWKIEIKFQGVDEIQVEWHLEDTSKIGSQSLSDWVKEKVFVSKDTGEQMNIWHVQCTEIKDLQELALIMQEAPWGMS